MAAAYDVDRRVVLALRGQALVRVAYVTAVRDDPPDWNWASVD